jgi:cytochrome c
MIKAIVLIAALAAGAVFPGAALANDKKGAALAKSKGCFACHSADKKLVGPSYRDIADKYRGQKDAEALLAKRVKGGSKGVWGPVPMPPNAHVKDDEIQTLVRWILSTR